MERLKRRVYNSHNRWSAVRDKEREKEKEERTLCLYECLRAVGLQRHYARFTSMGVCRAAHLSALTMEDYPILGICTMEDRARLFHLVQMVKTDLESLVCKDDDYGDEGYAVMDSSLTYDAYRDPDEDVYDHRADNGAVVNNINAACFARPSCVRRRLDFSCETTDQQKLLYRPKGTVHTDANPNRNYGPVQGKLSTIPVQLELDSGNAVVCGSKGSNNHRTDVDSHLSNHRTEVNTKPDIIGGISLYNSHKRLSSKCVSIHKPIPRPATVTPKRFNNKRFGRKDRKGISRKENLCAERGSNEAFRHMAKPTQVYESKRAAGYNYGLPQSSLRTLNKKRAGDQRISVCVRKRPLTHAESRSGDADVVTTPGGECVIVHESKEAVDLTQYILQHRFYFDQVFGEESSNEEVYQSTAYPLVQHMLSGGKATCFAYGQTGAGKTHTMLGSSPRRPGLYALAVRDIFAHLSTTHTLSPLLVYVSFFEIYRGQLYDLLDNRKRLFAREDGQKVVHIAGLRDVRVDSVSSLLEVISQGMGERTQGMSGVNPLSSRSHALLQIQLRCQNQQIAGRMWFVDLAGSERASDTKEPDRQSRMEGAEINQSLLALKECIRSLDQEQSHTPFRQSKLTQVLKDSFVGDSMTCMIANISPGHLATEHTLNTLRYADRVKELRRQEGGRGGRRGKTLPSPKHNLFNSSTGGTRGKSPPKKAKLGRQREAFGLTSPSTMLPMREKILCSTPKNSRWGEETSPRGNKGIGCEHITQVRGWLGTVDKREMMNRAGEQKVRGRESEKTDSHSVSCIKGRAGLELGRSTGEGLGHNGNLSLTQKESVFSHREKEQTQKSNLKVGREEKRKWIEQLKQVESRTHTCREVEMQHERDFKKADEEDKEKERHLRWYHQQLQQFMPSSLHLFSPFQCPSLFSSNQASPSPSISPSSCSSLQQSPCMSLSALMYHSLDEVLEEYKDRFQVKADDNRGQYPFPSGEISMQPETSFSCKNNNNEDVHDNSDGTGRDWKLHWEQTFGRDIGESEERRSVKAKGKARARNEHKRTARIEGGERRWAWVATTNTEHSDRMTGALSNNAETQVPYNCDSEDRREVDKEGLTASDIPANGLWSTKEGGGADSCSLVSAHSNNSNSLLYPSPFESPYQQAPAEQPFSPACEHKNTLLTPNKLNDVSSESKHFGCTSNILPLPLQNTPQAVPSSSHREKEQWFATNANRRPFSNAQSSTQPLTISTTQTVFKKSAKPINKLCKNPAHTQAHHHPEVKPDEIYADSPSGIMDPLSISLLQVDQQVATASFLQEEQNTTSVCSQKNDMGEDSRKKVEEDKLLQLKTQCSPSSDTVINHTEQRKDICCATYGHCGIGRERHHIPEDRLVSLQDLEDTQKPQTMQAIEVLGNKAPAQPLNPSTYAVIQSIPPSVLYSNSTGSSSLHNLIPTGATQMPQQHGHNMYRKYASTISTPQSENILGHLNAVPSQCHTVHSHHFRDSNNSLKPNSPTETNGQESTSNQQIRPIIHLPALKDRDHAQWCVIRAHWEQLEEMEALCHKEGVLLCQQPDMAFREYVQKLEKIMERKAQCVHSMRAQLQPYLMSSHSSQSHNQEEHNNDSVI